MRSKFYLLTTICVTCLPIAASAEMFNTANSYVSGAGIWNILSDEKVRDTTNPNSLKADFDKGWGANIALGVRLNSNYRAEIEGGYRDNMVRNIDGATSQGSGRNRAITLMVNGLYDFVNTSPFTPYIGVGIGMADIRYSHVRLSDTTTIQDSNLVPAAQGIVGVSYKVTNNVSLYTNYQYLVTSRYKLKSENAVGSDQYHSNSILVGVTYNFGVPNKVVEAPAPTPVAEPESQPQPVVQAQPATIPASYQLFFDWNQASLTPEGSQVLKSAVEDVHKKGVRIDVTGHTDSSGSDAYNIKLSKRRAETVKKAMVAMGITEKDIVIYAKGKAGQLVATEDGVREPQNRRVEIVYSAQ